MSSIPPSVSTIITTLQYKLQATLHSELVGLYIRGSLARGDFEPERSDIDLLAVTNNPLDKEKYLLLKSLHKGISTMKNPYSNRLEIAYIDRHRLRTYQAGCQHITLNQGEDLSWITHGYNWILERRMLREFGKPLIGPDPKTLIDPIPPEVIKVAAAYRLKDWRNWAVDPIDPDWQLPLSHKAYVIETMCRILYTVIHGSILSKAESVAWGLTSIPKPWRNTVHRSQDWRMDLRVDPSINNEVRDFICWTAKYVDKLIETHRIT